MGLRFAQEYDPELRKIKEEKDKATNKIPDTSSECVKARNKAYQAVDDSGSYPSTSCSTVKTQVQLFP
jgi:hypothetical protein